MKSIWRQTAILCIALAIPMAIAPKVLAAVDVQGDNHAELSSGEIQELENAESHSADVLSIGSGEENQFLQMMGVLFVVVLVLALIGAAAEKDDEGY